MFCCLAAVNCEKTLAASSVIRDLTTAAEISPGVVRLCFESDMKTTGGVV